MIEHQIEFWKHLAIDSISNDDAYIFATGFKSPLINLVILKNQKHDSIEPLINKAKEFFKKNNVPWGVSIVEDDSSPKIIDDLTRLGFKKICRQYEIDTNIISLNKNTPSNKDVIEVTNSEMLKEWVIPIADAYESAAQDTNLYYQLNKKAFESESNILKHFILYNDGKPTCSASLSFFNQTARLDNIATIKEKQRLGFGKIITQHCINRAQKEHCQRMTFESSEEGINLYRKLGFSETGNSYIYSLSE